ncbi:Integrase, catalytic region, Zinc finger, CCHC-type, Peptidase aspartic, catalytic-like protein [Theobroma cacao]|uniref:Integrase, catalytic region, Zinc finger, CCHC-type, Peptidase aspartic, catalytic-like protein n=1 Tax=Theobroma cacao TaxID=3641 RepID=A0A061DVS3_THECC|nr:Integrase, catalytic region, Zinc finger, CCHC-type, Peptidase aspartic, catalytic-like protein [Theobroma cacao]
MNFKLYQMDVKSAFLNRLIQEEVFVEQPPDFEDFEKSDHVFKLHKALYGLKQAPRAWYKRLSKFLVENGYDRGNIDTTLFNKRYLNNLIVVQIYVDDIIFSATNEALCKNFAKGMQGEFEMSMMGELKCFLGLQIKQSEEGIFINQERYTHDMLKKFDVLKLKSISTPMSPSTKLDLDEKGKDVDQKLYRGMVGSFLYLTKKGIWVKRYDMDLVKARDQAIHYGSLIKMGYVLDGDKFMKTFKSGLRKDRSVLVQLEEAPSRFSSKMIFNLLMRIDGKLTDQGVKLQKMEDKITELENKLKEKEKMASEPVVVHSSVTSYTAPAQQGAKGSAEPAEKSASSGTQAEGFTYKFDSPILQIEDSPQGVDQPAKSPSPKTQSKNDSE